VLSWRTCFVWAVPVVSQAQALAISIFYAIGTGTGGFIAPVLFGWLIDSGDRASVAAGHTGRPAGAAACGACGAQAAGRGGQDGLIT